MEEYKNLVRTVLEEGNYKPNRTAADTISYPHYSYSVDLSEGFPLLTTKKMDGFRWDSMIHEFVWYLSGEHHVRDLREKTGIWDEWATEEGYLDTAYGRFWRRYPIPDEENQLPGESWATGDNKHVNEEGTFDQLSYVLDNLKNNPNTRRNVVVAWHPANAAVSTLPPCHYTFVFNVQEGNVLNTHLTQRSADIALGVPFNIASYAILTHVMANQANLEVGKFSHTLNDAHIYCGDERGEWYSKNLSEFQETLKKKGIQEAQDMVVDKIKSDKEKYKNYRNSFMKETEDRSFKGIYDHVPGLLEQISRDTKGRSKISITDKHMDDLEFDDISLENYKSHGGIKFSVLA